MRAHARHATSACLGAGDRASDAARRDGGRSSCRSMPMSTTASSSPQGLRNYWGYNTIGFFAPEPRYMSQNADLGDADHGAPASMPPGSRWSSTWSTTTPPRATNWGRPCRSAGSTTAPITGCSTTGGYYVNDTGTGNTLTRRPIRWCCAWSWTAMRYWVEVLHVDGFRFDLATMLATRGAWLRPARRLPRRAAAGPGTGQRQADRGALGPWAGRLPAGQLAASVPGVQRQVSATASAGSGAATRG